jgi:uncharacterized protein YecE (DUF72 family)
LSARAGSTTLRAVVPRGDETQIELFGAESPSAPRARSVAPAPAPPGIAALARRLAPGIRLGTSSWSFPGWKGIVYAGAYSSEELARDGLAAYARHPLLRAVGVDRTYYAPLPAGELARYAEATPADFRFLMKAHELCTLPAFTRSPRHVAREGDANPRFLDAAYAAEAVVAPCVEGLGARLGAILFQFPPLGAGATHDPVAFAGRLHAFLAALPRGPLYAVELRSRVLLGPEYARALEAAGAVHCLNAHPRMPDVARQHAVVSAERAPDAPPRPLVVRWMLGHGLGYEEARDRYRPFDRIVAEDRATREAIAALVRGAANAGREAIVIINNKAEGSAPLSAVHLAQAIVQGGPGPAP